MKNLNIIAELEKEITNAVTYTEDGRQIVVNCCKKLYNIIEDKLYNKYGEDAILDAYNDLLNGDFAEPFMCDQKKAKFTLYKDIFINNVLPKLKK